MSDPSAIAAGQLVGERYRIVRKIGEGGMGTVFEAVQEGLGRKVALKLLLPEYARVAEVVARFRREAESAAALGHPNIVQVTDFGLSANSGAYLVMELLKGESLAGRIDRVGALPVAEVVFIARQVLAALEVAHAAGLVHRDLKPANIFLTEMAGIANVVKLLDFGIARLVGSETDPKLTATGAVLGTPAYMAPEQARGRGVDARSDLYSLGALMYEALSGRSPFEAASYNALLFAIIEETPAPLGPIRADVPTEIIGVIERAMRKSPDERYGSAAEMTAALDAASGGLQGSSLPARGTAPSGTPLESAARDHVATAPTIAASYPSVRAVTPPPNAAGAPAVSRRKIGVVIAGVVAIAGFFGLLAVMRPRETQMRASAREVAPADAHVTEAGRVSATQNATRDASMRAHDGAAATGLAVRATDRDSGAGGAQIPANVAAPDAAIAGRAPDVPSLPRPGVGSTAPASAPTTTRAPPAALGNVYIADYNPRQIDGHALQDAFASNAHVRRCFAQSMGLSFENFSVWVLSVSAAGRVTGARAVVSRAGEQAHMRCMASALRSVRIRSITEAQRVSVSLSQSRNDYLYR